MKETQEQRRARLAYILSRYDFQLLTPLEREVVGVVLENNRPMSAYDLYQNLIPIYVARMGGKNTPYGEYNIYAFRAQASDYGSTEKLAKHYREELKGKNMPVIPSFPKLKRLIDDFAETKWFEKVENKLWNEKREPEKKKRGRPSIPTTYALFENVKDKVKRVKDFSKINKNL